MNIYLMHLEMEFAQVLEALLRNFIHLITFQDKVTEMKNKSMEICNTDVEVQVQLNLFQEK